MIIVNADDCGISKHVNEEIRSCIEEGIITSTTIMANMEAFDGALALYDDYHDYVSFGIHVNLTEGVPLLNSQLLLDRGFYKENKGKIHLNGKAYMLKKIDKAMRGEIYKEVSAQVEKLLDNGVSLSHIDSHHHIHTRPYILPVICKVAKKYGITKMRRDLNVTEFISYKNNLWQWGWKYYMKLLNYHLRCVDKASSATNFYSLILNRGLYSDKIDYELMCHPGNPGEGFQKEMFMMKENPLGKGDFSLYMSNYYLF